MAPCDVSIHIICSIGGGNDFTSRRNSAHISPLVKAELLGINEEGLYCLMKS